MKSRANPPVPNLLYNGWVTRWVPGALRHFQLNAPKRSSTKFLVGFRNVRFPTGPIPRKRKRMRSIITTVGAVSISRIPTATS